MSLLITDAGRLIYYFLKFLFVLLNIGLLYHLISFLRESYLFIIIEDKVKKDLMKEDIKKRSSKILYLMLYFILFIAINYFIPFQLENEIEFQKINYSNIKFKNQEFEKISFEYNIEKLASDQKLLISNEKIRITDTNNNSYKPIVVNDKKTKKNKLVELLFENQTRDNINVYKKGEYYLEIIFPKIKENNHLIKIDLSDFVLYYDLKNNELLNVRKVENEKGYNFLR